jgi:hypothetical protein
MLGKQAKPPVIRRLCDTIQLSGFEAGRIRSKLAEMKVGRTLLTASSAELAGGLLAENCQLSVLNSTPKSPKWKEL